MARRLALTTACELRAFFAAHGLRPKKSLGQNFLVDANLLRAVADAAEVWGNDVVLEIGAGTGALTEVLAERAGFVVGVEIDARLFEAARQALAPLDNVVLLLGSILAEDKTIAPSVLGAVRDAMARRPGATFKVVGDLPYSVATAVLEALMTMEPRPVLVTGTVQLEVAERLCAPAGAKAYGYLTVLTQSRARAEILRTLPPQVYWPRPKVSSALVRVTPDEALHAPLPESDALKRTASALFRARRKTAANALMMAGVAASRAEAEALLADVGVEAGRRADALTVEEIVALARLLESRGDGR